MAAGMFDSTPSGFHLGGLSEREQVSGYLDSVFVFLFVFGTGDWVFGKGDCSAEILCKTEA